MENKISKKQHKANVNNSKLGGVKTSEGKEISKYNAVKHGVLNKNFTAWEITQRSDITQELRNELNPRGVLEEILLGIVVNCYIRVKRAVRADEEYLKSILNPPDTSWEDLEFVGGYKAIIPEKAVQVLADSYSRYIAVCEHQFYKALEVLRKTIEARSATQGAGGQG